MRLDMGKATTGERVLTPGTYRTMGLQTYSCQNCATISDPEKQAHACLCELSEPSTEQMTKLKAAANEASASKLARHASARDAVQSSGMQTGILDPRRGSRQGS